MADLVKTEVVKFNVGGEVFETTKVTASVSDYLRNLLSMIDPSQQTPGSEPVFIDRDPELFRRVLTIMRGGTLPHSEMDPQLVQELQFYGLDSDKVKAHLLPPDMEVCRHEIVRVRQERHSRLDIVFWAVIDGAEHVRGKTSELAGPDGQMQSINLSVLSSLGFSPMELKDDATERVYARTVKSVVKYYPKSAALAPIGLKVEELSDCQFVKVEVTESIRPVCNPVLAKPTPPPAEAKAPASPARPKRAV
uniref:BTB domain-containing protein n=1 Tax=Chromera velia CCMP2878 TaxID=1169474 RepID=A0A0G4HME0_9ALVE|eukprot:Cvel_29037.t1-p1 / transcript=Cvel_29037.t1 / gene=Cvel_29037 / organism=Chromera_velia_CCMP2878 / gene_product=BTB/POZ domain-containing protein At3g09030, putative / transcript_product=BTB/POZ domain-containing protein At3g09030, putative / location=Cvel_scaffold3913:2351-3097(-) / protein_length=249 / sequence_SO=supercontig / SO=protein_coding / is_pseudo=false